MLPHPPSPILELRVTKSLRTGVYSSQDIIVGFTFSGSLFCLGCLGFSCFLFLFSFSFCVKFRATTPAPCPHLRVLDYLICQCRSSTNTCTCDLIEACRSLRANDQPRLVRWCGPSQRFQSSSGVFWLTCLAPPPPLPLPTCLPTGAVFCLPVRTVCSFRSIHGTHFRLQFILDGSVLLMSTQWYHFKTSQSLSTPASEL